MKNKTKQNKNPLVSVVIPVFNGAQYLEETVNSVENSDYKKFEVLLIDDKSTDKSRHICHALEKKYRNVRFYSFPKNRGLGHVLNFALKKAHGDLICRINQDDRMLRHRIAEQVSYLQKNHSVVAVGSWIKLFRNNNQVEIIKFLEKDRDIKKMWLLVSPFADPSVMYRKNVAIEVGGYDQAFWPGDDTHLWMRMGLLGHLANIQKPLVEVRFHDQAASVFHFRKLAIATYNLHRYAHNYIEKAPIKIQIFWILQLICGLLLPPKFNWAVYRSLKKFIDFTQVLRGRLTNTKKKKTAPKSVIAHPTKFRLSGT